jgi:hypothetical protein
VAARDARTCFFPAPAAVLALATALSLGGCSGSSTTSGGAASPGVASAPQPAASTRSHHHRSRHRRGRHGSGTAAGAVVGAAVVGAAAGGAAAATSPATGTATSGATGSSWPCNDAQFTQDQQQFANGTLRGDQEVDVCGTVTQVLASQTTRSGLHGYYYVQVAPGDTIEIVSDLDQMDAPAWPWVKVGDYSYVQGRYYYDSPLSQGVDWTHHGTSNSWPTAGYVVVNGTEYQ